jgi:hypothetical protein
VPQWLLVPVRVLLPRGILVKGRVKPPTPLAPVLRPPGDRSPRHVKWQQQQQQEEEEEEAARAYNGAPLWAVLLRVWVCLHRVRRRCRQELYSPGGAATWGKVVNCRAHADCWHAGKQAPSLCCAACVVLLVAGRLVWWLRAAGLDWRAGVAIHMGSMCYVAAPAAAFGSNTPR